MADVLQPVFLLQRKCQRVVANITSSRGDGKPKISDITDSALILSLNHSGLLVLCGDKVYNVFPPKWSGQCGPRPLTLSVTRRSALNASQIAELGPFVHEVVPH